MIPHHHLHHEHHWSMEVGGGVRKKYQNNKDITFFSEKFLWILMREDLK